MRLQTETVTAVSLLFAAVLAFLMSVVLAEMSLKLAFGIGLLLAVLIAAVASNQLALYILICSMLLGPQVLVGELGTGAMLGRGLTLRLDDFLVAIIGLAWLAKTALYKELGLVFQTPLNRPIAAYAFVAALSTSLGILAGGVRPLAGTLFVLKYIEYFLIYFMVVNNLRERRQFERLLLALLGTAAIASLIGVLQIPSVERVSAPFEGPGGEPNTFGGYLVLMLALVAGLYLTSETPRQKFMLACLAGLILLPLLFTLSRASYLALLPMAGALFVWSERKRFLASIFALCLVLAPLLAPKAVVDRILYTISQPAEPDQIKVGDIRLDTSTSERLRAWSVALTRDWPKHPLLGFGVTGYRLLDVQYVRVLLESGLVGLTVFVWLLVSVFREARAAFMAARDPLFRGVALGFLAGFLGLIPHSLGANTFVIVRIMEPFWALAGMVIMIPELERQSASQPSPHGPSGRPCGECADQPPDRSTRAGKSGPAAVIRDESLGAGGRSLVP